MSTRKRNEFLDIEDSEDDERGYDSEDESRARMLPSSKRQKVEHDSENDDDADTDNEDQEAEAEEEKDGNDDSDVDNDDDVPYDKSAELAHLEKLAASLPSELKLKSTTLGEVLPPSSLKKDKSGVIYLSRVPPFMKPTVLRSLLTPYGDIGRIFLTPEPSTSRTQRLRSGGTRRKLYLDGWVEFLKKRDAKFVAENLNAQTMGGKKRGRWHDEVWNIKYLSGVKWSHLVEQIQNENAERAARLRFEIQQGKKENKAFLENLERGKMLSGIEATRKKRGEEMDDERAPGAEAASTAVPGDSKAASEKPRRRKGRLEFTQHTATSKAFKKPEPGQDVHRVLSSMM
ncbi:similar to pre-rRNA-processing protein esf2 [Plenodomus lingam JN3]|uniref:18S rRNA factor 2 n=1 Tax=Leptosphaeria maculans (strain JN3 / isolate v23.1.3 / race Av1-4-5-6-7-8) TaxID=985895 RepID=E4ZN17_LEPMJ|nr:similar to pre-rRNA-processing protein esf2 [Plenodomus lingam JN3]CBX92620.1 similar to pre-rRNA-processing protein esf2 [Plenodomus lingam JN3]